MNTFSYWIPILKKQYFKAKLTNDNKTIEAITENIKSNWNLTEEEKIKILKEIRGELWKEK